MKTRSSCRSPIRAGSDGPGAAAALHAQVGEEMRRRPARGARLGDFQTGAILGVPAGGLPLPATRTCACSDQNAHVKITGGFLEEPGKNTPFIGMNCPAGWACTRWWAGSRVRGLISEESNRRLTSHADQRREVIEQDQRDLRQTSTKSARVHVADGGMKRRKIARRAGERVHTGAIARGIEPAEQDLNQHHADQHVERGLQQADRRQTEKDTRWRSGCSPGSPPPHPQRAGSA